MAIFRFFKDDGRLGYSKVQNFNRHYGAEGKYASQISCRSDDLLAQNMCTSVNSDIAVIHCRIKIWPFFDFRWWRPPEYFSILRSLHAETSTLFAFSSVVIFLATTCCNVHRRHLLLWLPSLIIRSIMALSSASLWVGVKSFTMAY